MSEISIHAPHARSDLRLRHLHDNPSIYFNPRPSCEERHRNPFTIYKFILFQSTPLMRGATTYFFPTRIRHDPFQSTPLMRGATCSICDDEGHIKTISIHAPHARSDLQPHFICNVSFYFNPRPSCEERPNK